MSVVSDTLIFTNKGLLPIKFLTSEPLILFCSLFEMLDINYLIEAFNEDSVKANKICNLGNGQLIKITVQNNYSLCCSMDQLILLKDDIWKEAKDLQVGDQCVLKTRYHCYKKEDEEREDNLSIDHILESSRDRQYRYVQSLIKEDEIDLTNFDKTEQEQLQLLLLSLGMISNRENNKINFIKKIDEKETYLPVIDKSIIDCSEIYSLMSEGNDYIANGFVLKNDYV